MHCQTFNAKYAFIPQCTGECVHLGTHCFHVSSWTPPNIWAVWMLTVALAERMPLHFQHQPSDLCLQANVYDKSHLAPRPRLNDQWNKHCC